MSQAIFSSMSSALRYVLAENQVHTFELNPGMDTENIIDEITGAIYKVEHAIETEWANKKVSQGRR